MCVGGFVRILGCVFVTVCVQLVDCQGSHSLSSVLKSMTTTVHDSMTTTVHDSMTTTVHDSMTTTVHDSFVYTIHSVSHHKMFFPF